nr:MULTISPECIES: hypothetical protein [unclassified Tardiphaga]
MSSIPREALNTRGLEARRDRGCELDAERLGAGDQFLRIRNVGRRNLVHHVGGGIAEHPLGADVEDLDDALGVGGDAGEVRTVEDRALQRANPRRLVFSIEHGIPPATPALS